MLVTVIIILGIIVAGGFLLYFLGDIFMGLATRESKDAKAVNKAQLKKQKELEERINALEKSKEMKKDPVIATVLYNEPTVQEVVKEEPKEEVVEEIHVEEPEAREEDKDLDDQIAKRRKELMERLARMQEDSEEEEEEPQVEEVEEVEETIEEPAKTTIKETAPVNVSEVEIQLAEAQDRLKANERELRQVKKEFIPLKKVKKTLENDEKKLRRKEALVAKQKVVLYGVNNYEDIDEEKAKKLAEDLDLLDGLKLSVQHCHDVINSNKERYPLLEQLYTVLSNKNAELKAEVKRLQALLNNEE